MKLNKFFKDCYASPSKLLAAAKKAGAFVSDKDTKTYIAFKDKSILCIDKTNGDIFCADAMGRKRKSLQ